MLRRTIPTAERTVTRGGDKTIDKGDAIRKRPLVNGIIVPRRGRSSATKRETVHIIRAEE
jgi:hypothetical protein